MAGRSRRYADLTPKVRAPRSCDVCGELITKEQDPGHHRFRHFDCSPPPLPPIAREIIAAARRRAEKL